MTTDALLKLLDDVDCQNATIFDSFVKANSVINLNGYNSAICTISGGSDSDIVLDMCHKVDDRKIITYVWFDTGLEYQATKDHLSYLEQKYDIQIVRKKAKMSIPTSCNRYGEPFLNKRTSDFIHRLQQHNFQWEDDEFEVLLKKYPKCTAALRWWCNAWESDSNSRFGICNNKYLKEFMTMNPPTFKISGKCCDGAKKSVLKDTLKEIDVDLNIFGVRKAEGGARASAYKNCYDTTLPTPQFRPIFWFSNKDKEDYERMFGIRHSKCYTEYGLARTGCAGCPFGRDCEEEVRVIEKYEPKLHKAVSNIFANSYEYTKRFKEFKKLMDNGSEEQLEIFDLLKGNRQ